MDVPEKLLKDKLGRRRRNAPRQPDKDKTFVLNDRDLLILSFIHLYGGMLTTEIIWQYAKHTKIYDNRASLSRRLKDLYHNGYLDRPQGQRRIIYPERFNLVHRVSEKAEGVLKTQRLFSEYAPRPYGAYEHQMMTACLYASYFIHCLQTGIGFKGQHELKRHPSIMVGEKKVTPDALFMLTVNSKDVLIFLEADRATESGHSTDTKRKSWGRSVEEYREIIGNKLYKAHYGVSEATGAQVHVVTINFTMQQKILRQIQRVMPKGCTYILTHTSSYFGEDAHPPAFMPMLNTVWDRWGYDEFRYLK